MNLHQEHHFEREICAHLAANGWLHAEGDAAQLGFPGGALVHFAVSQSEVMTATRLAGSP